MTVIIKKYLNKWSYIPKLILLTMNLRSTDNLNLASKHIVTTQAESPYLVVNIALKLLK